MSTITGAEVNTNALSDAGPYCYGWRRKRETGPDGKPVWVDVPLRQVDLLHPEEGDVIVQNPEHGRNITYLAFVLRLSVAREPNSVVHEDVRTDWEVEGVKPHAPDIAVFRGLSKGWNKRCGTFLVKEFGAQPVLVIEVTSPSTRSHDLNEKVIEYHEAGVPLYVIVDYDEDDRSPQVRIMAYRTTPEGYVRIKPDKRGWVKLEPVGLWLAAEGDDAVCYDEDGQRIPGPVDAAEQGKAHREELQSLTAEAVKARHEAEAQAADAVQACQKAEAAAAEAARARQKAEAEAAEAAARAADLATRLAQMEAELNRLRGQA